MADLNIEPDKRKGSGTAPQEMALSTETAEAERKAGPITRRLLSGIRRGATKAFKQGEPVYSAFECGTPSLEQLTAMEPDKRLMALIDLAVASRIDKMLRTEGFHVEARSDSMGTRAFMTLFVHRPVGSRERKEAGLPSLAYDNEVRRIDSPFRQAIGRKQGSIPEGTERLDFDKIGKAPAGSIFVQISDGRPYLFEIVKPRHFRDNFFDEYAYVTVKYADGRVWNFSDYMAAVLDEFRSATQDEQRLWREFCGVKSGDASIKKTNATS